MLSFWILLGLLTCAATALVVWPLLSRRNIESARLADEDTRLAVYRDRRREIERERDAGRLTPQEAERALEELVAEAALLLPEAGAALHASADSPAVPRRRSAMPWAVVSALAVPAVAVGIYSLIGSPAIVGMDAATLRGELSPQRIEQAVTELSERVKRGPQDGESWAMLAEALRLQEKPVQAAEAYAKAVELLPPNARLLADYAETLVLVGHGNFAGRPVELLARALEVDPSDSKAIALMGAAQYRLGNLDEAVRYLKMLARDLPEGSEEAAQLAGAIARIEGERAGKAGAGAAASAAAAAGSGNGSGATAAAGAAGGASGGAPSSGVQAAAGAQAGSPKGDASVSGLVTIDEKLRAGVAPGAVLFIVARDPDGSRVPLAVARVPVDRWPVAFTLGDAQAMDPERLLSKTARVVVEARISTSGDATRRSGDPVGTSEPLQPGARDVTVRIDRQLP